jgi:hypothetical protein
MVKGFFWFPVFDYVADFSLGMRFFHSGLSFIFSVSSSYWIIPWFCRKCEYSMSFSTGTPSGYASSFRLCHAPSFMVSKNFSVLNFVRYFC